MQIDEALRTARASDGAHTLRDERTIRKQEGFMFKAVNDVRVRITVLTCGLVAAASAMAQSRGELLYTTHCISCHTTEMHWSDKRSANNWPALKVQVRRWQGAASLAWSDGDILDVCRYLNETIYHYEQTVDPVSSFNRGVNEPVSTLTRLAILRHP